MIFDDTQHLANEVFIDNNFIVVKPESLNQGYDVSELRCGGTKGGYDRIARSLAEKKGLPNRVGAAAAKKFFS